MFQLVVQPVTRTASAAQDSLLLSLKHSNICRGQPESRKASFAPKEGLHLLHEINCGSSWVWIIRLSCWLSPPTLTPQLQITLEEWALVHRVFSTALTTTPGTDQRGHSTTPYLKWQQSRCIKFYALTMFCGIGCMMRISLCTQEETILRNQRCWLLCCQLDTG